MRPLGGEIELEINNYTESFTDSGRSSLRLFFKQQKFRNKKILIPDFLCDIIIDVLKEEGIEYSFYKIDENFTITNETIKDDEFDILYVIHYFGNITKLEINLNDKILIEDYVFHKNFDNKLNHKQWYAFNSYRKISASYDGSHIKTNLDIDFNPIKPKEAPFVKFKKQGKGIKFNYINHQIGKEEDYLKELFLGENILDRQSDIYRISDISLGYLLSTNINQVVRKERFLLAKKEINNSLNISPSYFSFFIMKCDNREEIRKKLMDHSIFLPIYWKSKYVETDFSKQLLAVPLSEHFSDEEFLHMINTIKRLVI